MAGSDSTSSTDVAHAAESVGFPPFDATTFPSQLLWLAITFGVLYYVMSNVALPRIAGILEDRHDRIASDLDEAERLKQETDQAIAAYEQALSEARAKAGGIAQSTREKLNAEVSAKRAVVETDLAAKLSEAETRIAAIKSEAMAEVGGIATDTTEAVMDHLLAGSASAEEISSAVSSVLPANAGT